MSTTTSCKIKNKFLCEYMTTLVKQQPRAKNGRFLKISSQPRDKSGRFIRARKNTAVKTLIYVVLDQSGSMMSCKSSVISGFNEYIQAQKRQPNSDKVCLSLMLFDSVKTDIRHNNIALKFVPNLNNETYIPGACTPLYDAIGRAVKSIDTKKKQSVFFVVITDGEENSSHEFTRQTIFDLITDRTKNGWTFVYLGANQDVWQVGGSLGFSGGNTMSYNTNNAQQVFIATACATTAYRATGSVVSDSVFLDAGLTAKDFGNVTIHPTTKSKSKVKK